MPCDLGQVQVRPVPAQAQVSRKALTEGTSLPFATSKGSTGWHLHARSLDLELVRAGVENQHRPFLRLLSFFGSQFHHLNMR